MGMINMAKRTAASVPTPDTGRLVLFADSSTGQPQAKDSTGAVYTFVGPTGSRGSNWTTGTAVPTASGLAGDMYLKTDTGAVYQNTGGTSWAFVGNITGPQGPAVALGTTATDVSASPSAGGSASTASKTDHTHFHGNQAGGSLHSAVAPGGANGFMTGSDKSKLDAYGALSDATPQVDAATGAAGTSISPSRGDHRHAHGTQTDGTMHAAVTGAANGFMVSTDKTKLDAYGSLASSATDVSAAASAAGASTNLARQDHTHFHGNQAGGALHSLATTGAAGFMSAADKSAFNNSQANQVNILDFGGNGGGSADNSAAVAAAVAALGSGGGIVFFPNGDYNFTSPVTIAVGGVTLMGASRNNTRLKTAFTTGDFITMNEYYCSVQTMQLFSAVTRTSGYMIQAPQPYFRAKELLIYGTQSTGTLFGGIELGTTSILSSVDDVEVRHWTGVAVSVNGAGDKLINRLVTDNAAANTAQAGVRVTNTASLLMTNCNIIHAGSCLDIAPASGVTIPSVKAFNCFFDTSVIGLNMSSAGYFFRSEFTQCWFSSMTSAGVNFAPTTAGGINGVTFVACEIYNNVGGTTVGFNTNTNVGRWRMSSSNVAGWTTGINLVAGTNHYPALTNNTIGSVSSFGVNGTGMSLGSGAYKGFTIRNNDMADNTAPINIASPISASSPDLFEIGNNPGVLQSGAVSTVGAAVAHAAVETIVCQVKIPANAAVMGQVFRLRIFGANGTAATAATIRARIGTTGTLTDGGTVPAGLMLATAATANFLYMMEGFFTIRTVGASGALAVNFLGENGIVTAAPTKIISPATTVATINTTATWYITITAVAGAGGIVNQAVLEAV